MRPARAPTGYASRMEVPSWALQRDFDVRLRWERRGALTAADQGDALVVVDVLSFSTAVSYALAAGARVRPCDWADDPAAVAADAGAEACVHREDVPAKGRFSLSPTHTRHATAGDRIVLASPNGATCCVAAPRVPLLLVGGLVNAAAVARAARDHGGRVTVLACGERWPDGTLRPCLEDYLGAGAILAGLEGSLSPEAETCVAAFHANRERIAPLLWDAIGGRELRERGFEGDVKLASAYDTLDVVPVMSDGWLRAG